MGDANHVKLSPFNDSDVRNWLSLVDLQLDVVQQPKPKYARLLSALPASISSQVTDVTNRHIAASRAADDAIAAHGQAPNPAPLFNWAAAYNELKSALLERYSANDQTAIRQLLASQTLGDLKPSQFLRKLQACVAGRDIECADVIKEKFLSALPVQVRGPLGCLTNPPLNELAAAADNIYESIGEPSANINVVTRSTSGATASSNSNNEQPPLGFWQRIEASLAAVASHQATTDTEIAEIKQALKRIEGERGRSRDRSRGRSESRGRDNSNGNFDATDDTCYFHVRFGASARKCGKTKNGSRCKFASNSSAAVANVSSIDNAARDRFIDRLFVESISNKLRLTDSEN